MARPEIIKTHLAQRLTDIRKSLNYENRNDFSKLLNINKETLGGYERGDREPNVEFLSKYNELFSVDLTWLLTGNGNMFSDVDTAPNSVRLIDIDVLMKIAGAVEDVYYSLGKELSKVYLTRFAAEIYNAMHNSLQPTDFSNPAMLDADITAQMVRLRSSFTKSKDEIISKKQRRCS